mgnify:CR=1 FL=1
MAKQSIDLESLLILIGIGSLLLAGYFVSIGQVLRSYQLILLVVLGAVGVRLIRIGPTTWLRQWWESVLAFSFGFLIIVTTPLWWPLVADPIFGSLAHHRPASPVDPVLWLTLVTVYDLLGQPCSGQGCLFLMAPVYLLYSALGGATAVLTTSKFRRT